MNQDQRMDATIDGILSALQNVYSAGHIERLPRTGTAHRFIIHVKSPTAMIPDRSMNFAISDGTMAEITAHGHLDKLRAEIFLRDRDVFERLDSGFDVMI
jgi:hypothetical protein